MYIIRGQLVKNASGNYRNRFEKDILPDGKFDVVQTYNHQFNLTVYNLYDESEYEIGKIFPAMIDTSSILVDRVIIKNGKIEVA